MGYNTLVLYRNGQGMLALYGSKEIEVQKALDEFADRGWYDTHAIGVMPSSRVTNLAQGWQWIRVDTQSRYMANANKGVKL